MTWKLFIDDTRDPITNDWVVARSSTAAIRLVIEKGLPIEIAFDHDLGVDTSGKTDDTMKFVDWLSNQFIASFIKFPKGFQYSIHSMNPIGARNIANRMNAMIDHFGRYGE